MAKTGRKDNKAGSDSSDFSLEFNIRSYAVSLRQRCVTAG
jgi:hypothetical protein